jgi:hypothetical protein
MNTFAACNGETSVREAVMATARLHQQHLCLMTIFTENLDRSCKQFVFSKWDQFTWIL